MKKYLRKIALVALFLPTLAFQGTEVEETYPKNIILVIGDGMGLSQVSLSVLAMQGKSAFEKFTHTGIMKTASADNLITDAGAGATAFSTGKKTKNGAIGVDEYGMSHKTLLEYAIERGMGTGLVATSSITHATPAAFAAHVQSRNSEYEIAYQYLDKGINILIGGGEKFFINRPDGMNLLDSFRRRGYEVVEKSKRLERNTAATKLIGLFGEEGMEPAPKRKDILPTAARVAMQNLVTHQNGYFLMVEGSQIDWAGHANSLPWLGYEMEDFEKTLSAILEFASPNTLVIVLADHETGGYAINGGDQKRNTVTGAWTSKKHTGTLIPVFAKGPGAEQFTGLFDNTDIFNKLLPMIQARPIIVSHDLVPVRIPNSPGPVRR